MRSMTLCRTAARLAYTKEVDSPHVLPACQQRQADQHQQQAAVEKGQPPSPEIIDGDLEYEVEAIVDHRFIEARVLQYHVKWLGFSSQSNTWEPEPHCQHCPENVACGPGPAMAGPRASTTAADNRTAASLRPFVRWSPCHDLR